MLDISSAAANSARTLESEARPAPHSVVLGGQRSREEEVRPAAIRSGEARASSAPEGGAGNFRFA